MVEHGTAYVWLDKAVKIQNGYSKVQAMRPDILLNNAISYSRKKDKAKKKSLPICSSPHVILLRNLLNRVMHSECMCCTGYVMKKHARCMTRLKLKSG